MKLFLLRSFVDQQRQHEIFLLIWGQADALFVYFNISQEYGYQSLWMDLCKCLCKWYSYILKRLTVVLQDVEIIIHKIQCLTHPSTDTSTSAEN